MDIYDSIYISKLNFQGRKPKNPNATDKSSTLHNTSSLNGSPAIGKLPSQLDLDGKTPQKYMDNKPS